MKPANHRNEISFSDALVTTMLLKNHLRKAGYLPAWHNPDDARSVYQGNSMKIRFPGEKMHLENDLSPKSNIDDFTVEMIAYGMKQVLAQTLKYSTQ